MTWTFEWLEDGHVSLVTITENLDMAQVQAWMGRVLDVMNTNDNPYHTIIDMSSRPKAMVNPLKIQPVLDVVAHKNFGWLVLIGASPVISFWLELLHKTAKMRFKVFPTIADGIDFVQGQRLREVNSAAPAEESANKTI